MENNKFYIYCHRKKTDGKCFYIGKGCGYRYNSSGGRNQHWWNIVNKHGFEPEILLNNLSEQKAFELESYFCTQIGYENLCNIRTENGWGGYTMSESTKEKLKHIFTGRTLSENTKQKISNSNTGKTKTEEFKLNLSKKLKNHKCYSNPERNKKISDSLKNKPKSKSHVENMKKPKPKGFGEKLKNRKVTWGNNISKNRQNKGGKIVYQYDQQYNLISIYDSIKHASSTIHVNPVNLSKHLNGKTKTCKGFIFKFNKI
jgi:hypothetical protein